MGTLNNSTQQGVKSVALSCWQHNSELLTWMRQARPRAVIITCSTETAADAVSRTGLQSCTGVQGWLLVLFDKQEEYLRARSAQHRSMGLDQGFLCFCNSHADVEAHLLRSRVLRSSPF